jgi:hypothetical protein
MKRLRTKFISAGLIVVAALSCGCVRRLKLPPLTNNFDVPRNYFANGIIGDTNWDGVYLGLVTSLEATPAEAEVAPHLPRTPA